jgi:hypothetical protein
MLFKEIITFYTQNHIKHINTTCRVTDCLIRWCTYLALGFKGLIKTYVRSSVNVHYLMQYEIKKKTIKYQAINMSTVFYEVADHLAHIFI